MDQLETERELCLLVGIDMKFIQVWSATIKMQSKYTLV